MLNIIKTRALSDPTYPLMQLEQDGVISEELYVGGVADPYGSQHVALYGPTGEVLQYTNNQLHTKAPKREALALFNREICGSLAGNTIITFGPATISEFRKFSLFLFLDSTGAPTTLHVEVLFWDGINLEPHTYKQGLFASLFYEDTDLANGIREMFVGDLGSQLVGLKCTCAGGGAGAFFTVTAAMEFWG